MSNKLQRLFPSIQSRQEILNKVKQDPALNLVYSGWTKEHQDYFLDMCSGAKGCRILYDAFFKEVMNPETVPGRLENFLSLLMNQDVRILHALPNDSTRISAETSLLIMDIVVELEDHSIANVEVQRLGYMFPGQRSACYSADLLLRQYKRVKDTKKKKFSYKDIRKVYTIVLFERSPREFQNFPQIYVHKGNYVFNSGLNIELLQDYIFIPLDIFKETKHNKAITDNLDAWFAFFIEDEPDRIAELIQGWPQFKALYEDVYALCRNTREIMGLFSDELRMLDENTVQYMIDEMQDEIDARRKTISEQEEKITEQKETITEQKETITEQKETITEQKETITEQKETITEQKETIDRQRENMDRLMEQMEQLKKTNAALLAELKEKRDSL